MSKYLICATLKDADDKSRAAWEAVLARKKHPEDVTEFLWSRIANPDDAQVALVVPSDEDKLSESDRAKLSTELAEKFSQPGKTLG